MRSPMAGAQPRLKTANGRKLDDEQIGGAPDAKAGDCSAEILGFSPLVPVVGAAKWTNKLFRGLVGHLFRARYLSRRAISPCRWLAG